MNKSLKPNDIRITYQEALRKFKLILWRVKTGGTPVYEVRTYPINNRCGVEVAIKSVAHGSALWQHTDSWHTALIYIEAGKGIRFSREVLDLIATGVNSEAQFRNSWIAKNGNKEIGFFPRPKYSRTSVSRRSQSSYIVADQAKENPESKILGSLKRNITHRTHLISSQTTGIENHKGFLIDYDGWLNTMPMKNFEDSVLELTKKQDIIWTANVWRASDGLHLKYVMYDKNFQIVAQKEWVDDRWTYIWYVDKGQTKLISN